MLVLVLPDQFFWPPGGSNRPGWPCQQPSALLHRQWRHPAAVLHPPSQWRHHCPHCIGSWAGCNHDDLDSARDLTGEPQESEETHVVVFYVVLFQRRLTTRWRFRQRTKETRRCRRRSWSPSASLTSTTTCPSSRRSTTAWCCRYGGVDISVFTKAGQAFWLVEPQWELKFDEGDGQWAWPISQLCFCLFVCFGSKKNGKWECEHMFTCVKLPSAETGNVSNWVSVPILLGWISMCAFTYWYV